MTGFNLNYSLFDQTIPWAIRKATKDSQKMEIYNKITEDVAKIYDFNYPSYATTSFYPFKFKDQWYAVFSPTYNSTEIILLETGETVAKSGAEHWCPTNYYVPAYYVDREYKGKTWDENGEWKPVFCDYELSELEDEIDLTLENIEYSNSLFMCGVFWAADYEWLVYRLDIEKTLETGIIEAHPAAEDYCFDFDYASSPEIRQFIKAQTPEWNDDLKEYGRFYYYTQKFTTSGFKTKDNEEAEES